MADLMAEHDSLMEDLVDRIETHGLDPNADGVLDVIREVFGGEVRADFEDWIQ